MSEPQLESLVSIAHHNIALLFTNYLNSVGIKAIVEEQNKQFIVFCQHDKYDMAKQLFSEFIKNPHHEKYQQAAWDIGKVEEVFDDSPALLTLFKQQFLAHAGVVTLTIFTLCWLVYIGSLLGWQRNIYNEIHFFTQLTVEQFIDKPFKLIGPVFFHYSILHIAFNTMWWWQLGGAIEKVMGKVELVQLFILSAIVSNIGQYIVSGPNFGGLSGVVYAVVGYVWWAGWFAPEKGLSLSKPIIGFLLFWLLLGFVDVLPVNIANTAHLLGLVSGCFLAWLRFANQAKH